MAQAKVKFHSSLLELIIKPDMQLLHHRSAVFLVEAEALFGGHVLRARRLVVPVDLAQTFQYEPTLLRKVKRHFYKVATAMCLIWCTG